jgi:hypothetical protein
MTEKNEKRRYDPRVYEGMNLHIGFFFVTVLAITIEVFNVPDIPL